MQTFQFTILSLSFALLTTVFLIFFYVLLKGSIKAPCVLQYA